MAAAAPADRPVTGPATASALRVRHDAPLIDRYPPQALDLLPASLRRRHERSPDPAALAWELLYRLEPDLYDRLIAGERIHPRVLDRLPRGLTRAVEVGAGTGRLTVHLGRRCRRLVAVEPAAAMRRRLAARLRSETMGHVAVCGADDTALPVASGSMDAALVCAALAPQPRWAGDRAVAELERVCRPGGLVVVVWPHTPEWLEARGYRRETFDGDMAHEFASPEEAVELARIFYPDCADRVAALGSASVPYDVLDVNAPRDLAWRRVP